MNYKTKEEHVAEFLREGILAGRFARGARLKQADIAEQLDISITPVREAFRMLEAEGYIQNIAHRGVVVAPFDVTATREIIELRVVLESRLALVAMRNMSRADHRQLAALERDFEQAIAKGNRPAVRAMNYRFHTYLYSLAQQPQTQHFMQVLWAKYPFDLINMIEGRVGRAAREHGEILKAIAACDERAVLTAVREHIETGWRELQKDLEQDSVAGPPHPRKHQSSAVYLASRK